MSPCEGQWSRSGKPDGLDGFRAQIYKIYRHEETWYLDRLSQTRHGHNKLPNKLIANLLHKVRTQGAYMIYVIEYPALWCMTYMIRTPSCCLKCRCWDLVGKLCQTFTLWRSHQALAVAVCRDFFQQNLLAPHDLWRPNPRAKTFYMSRNLQRISAGWLLRYPTPLETLTRESQSVKSLTIEQD